MKLMLRDRVILRSILPEQGKYEDIVVKDDIVKKIAINQEELEQYEVVTVEPNGLKWNTTGATAEFEYEFTELETNMIKKVLEKLNTEEKLTSETFPLYKTFCI